MAVSRRCFVGCETRKFLTTKRVGVTIFHGLQGDEFTRVKNAFHSRRFVVDFYGQSFPDTPEILRDLSSRDNKALPLVFFMTSARCRGGFLRLFMGTVALLP